MSGRNTCWLACGWLAWAMFRGEAAPAPPRVLLRTNEVIALVGAGAWVAEQREGYLETALRETHPGHRLRIRNFAWEGDTVSSRPREVNYPGVAVLLQKFGATLALVQFGQSESFAGPAGLGAFRRDYARLLDELGAVTPRLVLVTPLPFESPPAPIVDVGQRNVQLAAYVQAIRDVGAERQLPVIDLFASHHPGAGLTTDGRQLSPLGQAVAAGAIAGATTLDAGLPPDPAGWFRQPRLKSLRDAVKAKNSLWIHHVRPTNWAFLAGDRVEQPSSRDHRDRNIRWFPGEVEQFGQLLRDAERQLDQPIPVAR